MPLGAAVVCSSSLEYGSRMVLNPSPAISLIISL